MDLLSDGSSSCGAADSEDDDDDDQGKVILPPSLKRVRGSVLILSCDDVPNGFFQRTVPHKRGHWAGHVKIPLQDTHVTSRRVQQTVVQFQSMLEAQGYSGTIVQHSQLHISLSKHFSLQLQWIESFVNKLTFFLSTERTTRVFMDVMNPFILVNDDKTRSFWCWKVMPGAVLQAIVSHVDRVLEDYKQPTYYELPVFHISIASFPGNLTDLSLKLPPPTTTVMLDAMPSDDHADPSSSDTVESGSDSSQEDDSQLIVVDQVVCQFGTTKTYPIPLASVP
jgi:Uncharacterised conserved protein